MKRGPLLGDRVTETNMEQDTRSKEELERTLHNAQSAYDMAKEQYKRQGLSAYHEHMFHLSKQIDYLRSKLETK